MPIRDFGGEALEFDPLDHFTKRELQRLDRFVQFGIVAAQMAFEDSGLELDKEDPNQIGVFVGSGIGGIQVVEQQKEILDKRGRAPCRTGRRRP